MKTIDIDGTALKVEAEKMGSDILNIAFLDEDDFALLMKWATTADLSRIVIADDEGEDAAYEGYTRLRAITALQSTPEDFWEGIRMVVALDKPAIE